MATRREPDAPDDNAPAAPVEAGRTERHLTKARALLRRARSRFDARDEEPIPTLPPTDDDDDR